MESLQETIDKSIAQKIAALQNNSDTEAAHGEADALLCELLLALGMVETVAEFKKLEKWYA